MTRTTNDCLKTHCIRLWGVSGIHVCAWRPYIRYSLAYRGVQACRGISMRSAGVQFTKLSWKKGSETKPHAQAGSNGFMMTEARGMYNCKTIHVRQSPANKRRRKTSICNTVQISNWDEGVEKRISRRPTCFGTIKTNTEMIRPHLTKLGGGE